MCYIFLGLKIIVWKDPALIKICCISLLSPSLPLSHYSFLLSLFISLICYWYKLSSPIVTTLKHSSFLFAVLQSQYGIPLVRYAWNKELHVFSLLEFRVKSTSPLNPSSPHESAQSSSDFAVIISLFHLCQQLSYSSGKGNVDCLLLIPAAVKARLQILV